MAMELPVWRCVLQSVPTMRAGWRMLHSSSETVGCIPTVASSCCLVMPAFMAAAKPCKGAAREGGEGRRERLCMEHALCPQQGCMTVGSTLIGLTIMATAESCPLAVVRAGALLREGEHGALAVHKCAGLMP